MQNGKLRTLAALLALLLIFAGCEQKQNDEYTSEREEPSQIQEENSQKEQEPEPWAWYPRRPGVQELESPDFWRQWYMGNTIIYSQGQSYRRGERLFIYNSVYMPIGDFLAEAGRLQEYPLVETEYERLFAIPWTHFDALAELYFGESNVPVAPQLIADHFPSLVDEEAQLIYLRIPNYYDENTHTWDYTGNDWLFADLEFREIVPYLEDGVQKVRIVTDRYNSGEKEYLIAHQERIFVWSPEVGFILESLDWEYPHTERVSIHGQVQRFDTLFGKDAHNTDDRLLMLGNTGYVIRSTDQGELRYDAIDFGTGQERIDLLLYDFEGEEVRSWYVREGGLFVITHQAVYRFDPLLKLAQRVELPDKVPLNSFVISSDLTALTWSGEDGLMWLDLSGDQSPKLLMEHPRKPNPTGFPDSELLFPSRMLPDGRIFAGISVWEAQSGYVLIDPTTGAHTRYDLIGSDIYGAFYLIDDQGAAFFHPEGDDMDGECYYLSFATGLLEEADWFPADRIWGAFYGPASFSNQGLSLFAYAEGTYNLPEQTTFLRIDFPEKTVEELPLKIDGAQGKILGVGDSGRMLVSWAWMGEHGFAFYDLPEQVHTD